MDENEKDGLCIFNDAICYFPKEKKIWGKPTKSNILITTGFLVLIGILLIYITSRIFPYDGPIYYRFLSISYISGILSIIVIIYDTEFLRAAIQSLFPLFFAFIIIIISYSDDIYMSFVQFLVGHFIHFIAIIISMGRGLSRWTYIAVWGIVWTTYIYVIFSLFPDFKMFFFLGMRETIMLLLFSTILMVFLVYSIKK